MSGSKGSYYIIGGVTGGAAIHQTVRGLAQEFQGIASVLYLGAASGNDPDYESVFARSFPGEESKISVSSLRLCPEDKSGGETDQQNIRKRFEGADIIFFEGGELRILRDVFERFKLKDLCRDAFERGASVGGLCIGGSYLGSTVIYSSAEDTELKIVHGLGLVEDTTITCYMGDKSQLMRLSMLENSAYREGQIGLGVPINQTVIWNGSQSGYQPLFKNSPYPIVYRPD